MNKPEAKYYKLKCNSCGKKLFFKEGDEIIECFCGVKYKKGDIKDIATEAYFLEILREIDKVLKS